MTLTTERIRDLYSFATRWETEGVPQHQAGLAAEFDAWLAEHDRELSEKRWAEGADLAARTGVILGAPADLPERVQGHNPHKEA